MFGEGRMGVGLAVVKASCHHLGEGVLVEGWDLWITRGRGKGLRWWVIALEVE